MKNRVKPLSIIRQACADPRPCGIRLPAAPIRPCNDLKEMTVGVLKIHPAATVVPVDFSSPLLARVCPILQPSIVDAGEGLIEVVFAYQEGIMLGGNLAIDLVEVE